MLVVYVKSSCFDLAPALGSCLVIEVLGSGESDNKQADATCSRMALLIKRISETPRCPPSDGAHPWFDGEVSYNGLVTSNATPVYAYLFLRRMARKSP
jgi:hypothetical protein